MATTSMSPLSTGLGATAGPPPHTIHTEMSSRVAPLKCREHFPSEITVRPLRRCRLATVPATNNDSANAATSVSMWPASASAQ
jgi:hypothetical protein